MRVAAPDDAGARPPFHSFIVTLCYSVLTVTSFTVVLPTSPFYMASFGAPQALVGVMIGLTPIFSGLMQPFIMPLLRHVPLRKVLIGFCLTNIVASSLYALGAQSGSVATVLVSRCLAGSVGGPAIPSTYVSRSTSLRHRSRYMMLVGVGIGCGYALGPLAGVLVELVCDRAGWNETALDTNTAPGWLMAILFALELGAICAFFVEPPRPTPPTASSPAAKGVPWARVAAVYVLVFATPINVGAWDVGTVFTGVDEWGWSLELTGLFLAGLNLSAVPVILLPVTKWLADRQGLLCSYALCALSSLFFFAYPNQNRDADVTLYALGSFLLLCGAQVAKGFAWALVSKLPPQHELPVVMSANAALYMFGRGTGAFIGAHLAGDHALGAFVLALNAAALLWTLGCYRLVEPPAA